MEFTYPLALLTAFGILLPILIHLWNRKLHKVLVVGSVKYLQEGKKQQVKKWYIKDWPLFLLRCALLLCLSLLLSDPRVSRDEQWSGGKGWVLLGKGYQQGLDERQRKQVDSLRELGYELRAFEDGFRSLEEIDKDTVKGVHDEFALIQKLDDRLPRGHAVSLFTAARAKDLQSPLPAVSVGLTWQSFGRPDTAERIWVQRAWQGVNDTIMLLLGRSSVVGTSFELQALQEDGRHQGIDLQVTNGTPQVKSAIQNEWIAVAQEPMRIQLLTEADRSDRRYIEALVASFEAYTFMPITLSAYASGEACDFLFDLRTEADSSAEYEEAKTVFRYARGAEEQEPRLGNKLLYANRSGNSDFPDLYKFIPHADTAKALWSDVYDRPVLTATERKGQLMLTFYGRLDPQWTSLVWSKDLVDYLIPLLFPESVLAGVPEDKRISRYDLGAYQGHINLPTATAKRNPPPSWVSLRGALVWIALFLFGCERIRTYRKKRKEVEDGIHAG
ncbi:BatA domain-containing protein [Olivibacter sp. XZL3]|uniref:BatA domain-containing protein n=1 Tax=Olivibacter sp. XZL3 TaxID=1735116 RepID=UPI001416F754|nr:BatA domain-containing protein [Olivibacter sp. XZL3]